MKTYFDTWVARAHVATTVIALGIAFSATLGFQSMTGSWLKSGVWGIVLAVGLGVFWWLLIDMAARMRRPGERARTVLFGLSLVAIATVTSGWAVATAIGGKEALSAFQQSAMESHSAALVDAKASVDGQRELVNVVRQTARATAMLADEEGRSGEGPLYRSYLRQEAVLDGIADTMDADLDASLAAHGAAKDALDSARSAMGTRGFDAHILASVGHIRSLAGTDVTKQVLNSGVVTLDDAGLPKLTAQTQNLYASAKASAPEALELPSYRPVAAHKAVALEWRDALGAWAAALGLELLPMLFLLGVLTVVLNPLMHEAVAPTKSVSDREVREANEELKG